MMIEMALMDQIEKGQATVRKESGFGGYVTIRQGNTRFFASSSESPNKKYLLAYRDGHCEKIGSEEKWIEGQVCLVEDQQNVLWSKKLRRPNDGVVSNDGKVAINNWLRAEEGLGGTLYVFDKNGRTLIEHSFKSNLANCSISNDGKYVAVATFFPDRNVYLFDTENAMLKWRYQGEVRALRLLFSNANKILVYTRPEEPDYSLTLDGKLTEESYRELQRIERIRKWEIKESLEALIVFLDSPEPSKVLKGLNETQSLLYNKRLRRYQEIIPHLSKHVKSNYKEISNLSIKLLLWIGRKSPKLVEDMLPKIVKKCEEYLAAPSSREGEYGLSTLGEISVISPVWAKKLVPVIIDRLENSKFWNERRFAAFAIGQIGKVDSDMVKDTVPILSRYLSSSDWWLPKIKELAKSDRDVALDLMSTRMLGIDPEVWVRNAAIGALGDIGEHNPDMVRDAIPMIISCLKMPEPYTRKRAIVALGQIARKGRSYVEMAIPILEEMAEKDPDQKNKSEAKRVLLRIGSRAAELSISRIPHLIADLASEDKIIRYKSIRELERMFYGRSPFDEKYYHEALLRMNQHSSDLERCINELKEELRIYTDKTIRSLLLESLLRAKRAFLEFIVGEYVSRDSVRCKMCGRVYKASGIRNHLARTHLERWKSIRPYSDDILQHLEDKRQSVLSAEEWERRLLRRYEKISRTRN